MSSASAHKGGDGEKKDGARKEHVVKGPEQEFIEWTEESRKVILWSFWADSEGEAGALIGAGRQALGVGRRGLGVPKLPAGRPVFIHFPENLILQPQPEPAHSSRTGFFPLNQQCCHYQASQPRATSAK